MSLNETVSAERVHISFFGMRNAGKSSVVNAFTGQKLAVVSDVKGTTTDPVRKAMELLPMGPVMIIDTPGIDDEGDLGKLRVEKSLEVLRQTDVAVLVVDGSKGIQEEDQLLIDAFEKKTLPYIIVFNKSDLKDFVMPAASSSAVAADTVSGEETGEQASAMQAIDGVKALAVSAITGQGIHELKETVASLAKTQEKEKKLVADLLQPGDVVLLVIPVDKAAPKGRLILPQQQTLRDILDAGAISMVCGVEEIPMALAALGKPPALVITDSQAFKRVAQLVPEEVPMTSFSILMARYKGNLKDAAEGAFALDKLKDGDVILISEGCTHHRQCEDIGTVKLPAWLKKHSGSDLEFEFTSGREFPEDLSRYAAVVHCGGCMLNDKEMEYRAAQAKEQGVPMTNYGITIAHINGILERSLRPLNL